MKRIGYVVLLIARWASTLPQWIDGAVYCLQQARVWRAEYSRRAHALYEAVESPASEEYKGKLAARADAAADAFDEWKSRAYDPDRCARAKPRQQLSLWGAS